MVSRGRQDSSMGSLGPTKWLSPSHNLYSTKSRVGKLKVNVIAVACRILYLIKLEMYPWSLLKWLRLDIKALRAVVRLNIYQRAGS